MKNPSYFLMLLISYSLSTCFSTVIAQADVQWNKTFIGNGYDILNDAIATDDGGYLLAGESNSDAQYDKSEPNKSYLTYSNDYWIIKINKDGSKQWDKTFGGDGFDILTTVTTATDGGYLLAGFSEYNISGDKSEDSRGGFDYWIVKTDAKGNKQWDKTYGGSNDDELNSVTSTADGGYLLAGTSGSGISGDKSKNSKGDTDYWVVKIDKDGNKQWDKTYGGNSYDELSHIISTTDGYYLLAGTSASNASGDKSKDSKGGTDYWIVKIDKHGSKQWDKTYGGDGYDGLSSFISTADGGYLLAGESNSGISGDKSEGYKGKTNFYDYWVIKIDKDGSKQWDKTYGGHDDDQLTSITSTTDGGYLLAGSSYSEASGDKSENTKGIYDYWIVKTDAKGNKQWDKTIGGDMEDVPNKVISIAEGGYLLAGTSSSSASGDKSRDGKGVSDYWVVKITEAESMLSIRNFTLINADTDKDINTLRNGSIIDLAKLDNPHLGIRANIKPVKGASIKLELSGPINHIQVERNWPYSLFGDKSGRDYIGQAWKPGDYILIATPYMNDKAGTPLSIAFSVIHTNATAALQAFRIEVYPIPTTGTVHINHDGADQTASLMLLDQSGNVLFSRTLAQQPTEQLDLSAYHKGMYYLKIINKETVETRRLILE